MSVIYPELIYLKNISRRYLTRFQILKQRSFIIYEQQMVWQQLKDHFLWFTCCSVSTWKCTSGYGGIYKLILHFRGNRILTFVWKNSCFLFSVVWACPKVAGQVCLTSALTLALAAYKRLQWRAQIFLHLRKRDLRQEETINSEK